jgi:FixJ family two-component response regulator
MQTNVRDFRSPERMDNAARVSSAAGPRGALTFEDVGSLVFVVDDDAVVRDTIEVLIGADGWHVETFPSAADFLLRPRATVPCCLLLDVTLRAHCGLELQRQLAGRSDMPIIFMTGYGDVPTTVRAMKAGAFDFLTKPLEDVVLLATVRQALERSRAVLLDETKVRALRSRYASLTPRERDVMALVVSGLLNKQVGGELGISEITVKAHRGQVMRKMSADSLPALVLMATRLAAAGAG